MGILLILVVQFFLQYLYSGLFFLLLSFQSSYIPRQHWYYVCEWPQACVCLMLGNIFHQIYYLNYKFVLISNLFIICTVIAMEEFGLRTGLIFGEYAFSNKFHNLDIKSNTEYVPLGPLLTYNLPYLVVCLWLCMVYPTFLLTNLLTGDGIGSLQLTTPSTTSTHSNIHDKKSDCATFVRILTAALLLCIIDLLNEPPMILFGHHYWRYLADTKINTEIIPYLYYDIQAVYNNTYDYNRLFDITYIPNAILNNTHRIPDWYFNTSNSSNANFNFFFGIPLQVCIFAYYAIDIFIIVIIILYLLLLLLLYRMLSAGLSLELSFIRECIIYMTTLCLIMHMHIRIQIVI